MGRLIYSFVRWIQRMMHSTIIDAEVPAERLQRHRWDNT